MSYNYHMIAVREQCYLGEFKQMTEMFHKVLSGDKA